MLYCLNPTCVHPENPDSNRFCHGCGEILANSSREYYFRVHYRVVKLLGEGAFGRTYLAEDTDLRGEPRVIKRFIAQGQGAILQKAKELFAREAQQLYELNHPQIPKLYAYFEQDNLLFLIQEFVEGENLFEEFSRQGKFSPEKVVKLLQELLEVLDYIHSKNVLHRDIKPENIMRRSDGKFILIDFGGAKVVTETVQNQTATALYTPGYAANEHIAGRPRPASDIYSLGVTCIRLLTGCLPQSGITGSLQDPLYDDDGGCWLWREMLQRQGTSVSQQLGEVLDTMVQSLPKNRYQSAREALTILNSSRQTVVQSRVIKNTAPPPVKTVVSQGPPAPVAPPPAVMTRKQFLQFAGWGSAGLMGMLAISFWLRNRETSPVSQNIPAETPQTSPVPTTQSLSKDNTFSFTTVTVNSQGEIINRQQQQAAYFIQDLGGDVKFDMVYIPGGTFTMGAPATEEGSDDSERPQHQVTVPAFYMGKFPVTQKLWQAVASLPKIKQDLDPNPSRFKGENRPVEQISWDDAVEFCARLSKFTGKEYRLPSESEWEYACRANTTTPFYFGETITTDLANFDGNYTYGKAPKGIYREETTQVGQFPPNAFGLFDMHGNVFEWCADNWHKNYQGAPTDGSAWLTNENDYHILRGGSWGLQPFDCRSAFRTYDSPDARDLNIGLRVVCVLPRTL